MGYRPTTYSKRYYNISGQSVNKDRDMKTEIIPISMDVVEKFLEYYRAHEDEVNKDEYTHFLMFDAETHYNALGDVLNDKEFCHGNILWHKAGIPPHVDECGMGNKYTVVIPLEVSDPNQKLIVFDQTYDVETTWLGDLVTEMNPDRSYGSERSEAPYKTPGVQGLTNEPCPEELTKHLPTYYGPDMYFGLTGEVVDYKVGTLIIFDSHRIHTTGNMNAEKIAVTTFVR